MPCYDPRGRSSYNEQINESNVSEIRELKERLNLVTRLLCRLSITIDIETVKDKELYEWLKEHRDFDKNRKKE